MDHQKWSLRFGAAVIAWAVVLRLASSGAFTPLAEFLAQPNIASFLIYIETGRIVRFSSSDAHPAFAGESAAPDFAKPADAPVEVPVFTAEDANTVEFKNNSPRSFDAEALIQKPLDWDLTADAPTVLILHTHTTESYTKSGEDYEESSPFRTLDEDHNMLSIGARLTELLEAGGITVLHDRALHDYPSYNGSYNDARKAMDRYLSEYPSIKLVLDLHRDAAGDNSNQMSTHATVGGKDSAQLMIVAGTNGTGLSHPNWPDNLALALKLQVQLERIAPGICRPINLRSQRFNQDKSPGALLIEVGAAGDTHAEALTAAEVLAEGILALAKGANRSE